MKGLRSNARLFGLLVAGGLMAGAFAGSAPATHVVGGDLLPDLVTLPPSDLQIANAKRKTKDLRFAYSAKNAHTGVLELTWKSEDCDGDGLARNDRTAVQRIFQDGDANGYFTRGTDTESRTLDVGCFDFHPRHHHWHLENFARYQLWTWTALAGRGTIVGTTDKVSFCIIDTFRVDPGLPDSPTEKFFDTCSRDGDQGLSVGWADTYGAHLDGQSIRLDSSAAGTYCLVATADPLNRIAESDDSNNETGIQVTISGATVAGGGSC